MVDTEAVKQYMACLKKADSVWEFGNNILYQMCKDNPMHEKKDVVVGKMWLIGRSYAAAIERRKNASDSSDDFYCDEVAPKMVGIGAELDERLKKLCTSKNPIIDDIEDILTTHKFLMDTLYDLTGLEKRSLVSKYLHFHCPEKFFIYDSRAREKIRKMVKKPDKNILSGIENYDAEYGNFVCRMLELQEYLNVKYGVYATPRSMDDFLLSRNL